MNPNLKHYAQRRLNPFTGVVEVVEAAGARALSPDGVNWEIQVLAEQPEHTWRTENRLSHVQRFFRFGSWSHEAGLRQVPVSPILDLDAMWRATGQLLAVLPDALERLPFPLRDHYERWLLDRDHQPLALVASTTEPRFVPDLRAQPWKATPLSEHGFVSASLLAQGIPQREGPDPRHHASELERRVRGAVGGPLHGNWFLRAADGNGQALSAETGEPVDSAPLPAGAFPDLPLRRHWDDPVTRALAEDYLDWLAPYLLTLHPLPDPQRERLEQAARRRPLLVETLHHLYPKLIRPELIRTARVEARIRRAGENDRRPNSSTP